MTKLNATITAVGGYVPEFVLTNKILESMVETNDQWIVSRTGIKERRILKGNELGSSFLAINAAKDLIAKKNIVLNTGHLSAKETINLVKCAKKIGVKKILIPSNTFNLKTISKLKSFKVKFEFSYFFVL